MQSLFCLLAQCSKGSSVSATSTWLLGYTLIYTLRCHHSDFFLFFMALSEIQSPGLIFKSDPCHFNIWSQITRLSSLYPCHMSYGGHIEIYADFCTQVCWRPLHAAASQLYVYHAIVMTANLKQRQISHFFLTYLQLK